MLKGLEAVELGYNFIKSENVGFRIESEYFKKEYKILKNKLLSKPHKKLLYFLSKSVQTGHTPSMQNSNFYGGNIKFIKTDNLRDNFIKPTFNHFLSEKGNNKIKRTFLKEQDIIVTIIGASHDIIARSCIIKKEILPANINQNIALIRVDKNKISPEFLNIYLTTRFGKKYLHYLSRQMEQVNLNCREVEQVIVPLLSKKFQLLIEALVIKAHANLEKSKNLYAQAETLLLETIGLTDFKPSKEPINIKSFKNSFLTTGRLDAEYYQKKYEEIENIIKKSKLGFQNISNVAKLKNGSFIPDTFYVEKAKRAYLRIKELSWNQPINTNKVIFITDDFKASNETTVKENDFVIATIGNTIGKINLVTKEFNESFISNNTSRLRLTVSTDNYYFYEILFRSFFVQEQIQKEFTQTAQPKISNTSIKNIIIPIIDYTKQQKIAELVEESFRLKKESAQLLETAKRAVEIAIETDEAEAVRFLTVD
ncbi:MAG: restriction endonuclease subunit S [Deltaproteobacteria bacterium]|nr:restriction endonuclease subunit S [Deltaproteobacteria bacterium]